MTGNGRGSVLGGGTYCLSEDNLMMNCLPVRRLSKVFDLGLHRKLLSGFYASQEMLTKLTRSTRDHYCSCIR